MSHVVINLKANKPTRQSFGIARYLTISSLGGAISIDVEIEVKGFAKESMRGLRERDRIDVGGAGFEAASFTAPIDCVIEVFASLVDLRLNNAEGAGVTATIAGPFPLSVEPTRGKNPAAPLYVTGLTYSDTPAGSVVDRVPVNVTAAGALLLPADPNRLEVLITNRGTDAVAIGAAGIAWANAAKVLYPGDSILEQKGAALAWYAITDAGTVASVAAQELKA